MTRPARTSRILDLLDLDSGDLPPRSGSDRTMIRTATVVRTSQGGRAVTITLLGSGEMTLPATASVWTNVFTAYVLCDPDTGRPVHVLGPASTEPPPPAGDDTVSPRPDDPTPRTFQQTIAPDWTGTYRAGHGWDTWRTHYDGGHTDLYQGSHGGSGLLHGMATYGRRVTALVGDGRVTAAYLTITGAEARTTPWQARLQAGEWHPFGPALSGPTTDPSTVRIGETTTIDITPLAPALVTGTGLVLVGADYGSLHGVGDSMCIHLTWEATL